MTAHEHDVVIAGGGPTGLMLAAELAIAGVDVVIVERRTTEEFDGSRAGGLHVRTLEVLDQRGVVDRFVAAGTTHPAVGFAYIPLSVADLPTRHNYVLALWQRESERLLADWVLGELGVPILRGVEVSGVAPDADGVTVTLAAAPTTPAPDAPPVAPAALRAAYLVGCDGGRSTVRPAVGIDFDGLTPSTSFIMAEVDMTEPPPIGTRPEGGGIGPSDPTTEGGPYGVVVKDRPVESGEAPTLDDLRAALTATYGTDFGAHSPRRISRFSDASRQAAAYRSGRVLLAGDAAHIHPPYGGQGLNLGVQDAVNLGWKLAQVVRGTSPDALLDTYHAERHPVGAGVLRNTEAQVALTTHDERHLSLRALVTDLLGLDEPRRTVAAMIAGLDIRYDLGDGHPLVGRRMPDLDLRIGGEVVRLFTLLHDARGVLLDLNGDTDGEGGGGFDVGRWSGRVRLVRAGCDPTFELPVIGEVPAPSAVLVRPDGYVAWAGPLDDADLTGSIDAWFGAAEG